jgi:predicted Ser/Thr protein kinase
VPFGTTVGKIQIVDRIAVGGMGEIYVGYDRKLKRKVAVKALRADRLTPESRARLLREARVLSRLNDPKICQIYDYVEGSENDFLVLELIEGRRRSRRGGIGGDDRSARFRSPAAPRLQSTSISTSSPQM